MASGRELEHMKNEAICSICLDFYKEPVTIDCGHNFCRACILQCWGSVGGDVACPQCRQMFRQRSVRTNRTLSNMVESLQILSVKPETSLNETSVFCQEHEEKLKLFCETDRKVICVVCAMSRDHKDHTVTPIKEAAEVRRQDMQKALEVLQKQLAKLSQHQSKEEANENEVKTQADSLQRNLESEFSKLQLLMTEEKRGLIQKLRQQEEITVRKIGNNKREISNQITEINQITAQIQTRQALQDTEFLKDIKSIIVNSGVEIKQPTTVAIDLAVGEFNGSLEDIVKERLRKAMFPAELLTDVLQDLDSIPVPRSLWHCPTFPIPSLPNLPPRASAQLAPAFCSSVAPSAPPFVTIPPYSGTLSLNQSALPFQSSSSLVPRNYSVQPPSPAPPKPPVIKFFRR